MDKTVRDDAECAAPLFCLGSAKSHKKTGEADNDKKRVVLEAKKKTQFRGRCAGDAGDGYSAPPRRFAGMKPFVA